ncbi:hypothetical protein AGIG_G13814 [Arapaima gigas]
MHSRSLHNLLDTWRLLTQQPLIFVGRVSLWLRPTIAGDSETRGRTRVCLGRVQRTLSTEAPADTVQQHEGSGPHLSPHLRNDLLPVEL